MAPHRQKSAVLLRPSPADAQVAEASPLACRRLYQFSSIVCGVAWSETLPQRDCSVALPCKHRSGHGCTCLQLRIADRGSVPERMRRAAPGTWPETTQRHYCTAPPASQFSLRNPNSTDPLSTSARSLQHRSCTHTSLSNPFAAGIWVTDTAAPRPGADRPVWNDQMQEAADPDPLPTHLRCFQVRFPFPASSRSFPRVTID